MVFAKTLQMALCSTLTCEICAQAVASPWLASTLTSSSDELNKAGTASQQLQWGSNRVPMRRLGPFASLGCSWNASSNLAPLGSVSMVGAAVTNALGSVVTPSQSSKDMNVDLSGTWIKVRASLHR